MWLRGQVEKSIILKSRESCDIPTRGLSKPEMVLSHFLRRVHANVCVSVFACARACVYEYHSWKQQNQDFS